MFKKEVRNQRINELLYVICGIIHPVTQLCPLVLDKDKSSAVYFTLQRNGFLFKINN